MRGLWGTSGGSGVLILRGFWAASYFFEGGSGGPAGEWRGGWRGTSEVYFWRGAVFLARRKAWVRIVLEKSLQRLGCASLFTKFVFTIFVTLNTPPRPTGKVTDFLWNLY